MEWNFKDFIITDDKSRVDPGRLEELFSDTYWASERNREIIETSIKNSICFSVIYRDLQIGFARIVTDYSTFAWIADVIVDKKFRGQGIGKKLMELIHMYPAISTAQQVLRTKDAHGLYEKFGFERTEFMRK